MAARGAPPRKPYFPHLTGSAGLWQADKPGFAQLASSSLGDAGSPADGTESRILELFNALSGGSSLLDNITRTGQDATAAVAAADGIKTGDIDGTIAAATAASSGAIGKIGAALGLLSTSPNWTAALGPAPSPPDTATTIAGGSSGGGGIGSPSTAALGLASGSYSAPLGGVLTYAGLPSSVVSVATGTALPVIGAFILFNELFNLPFEPQLEAYKEAFIKWYSEDPLAATLYADTQQMQELQQQLAGFPAGQAERNQVLNSISHLQSQINTVVAQILGQGKVPKPGH